MSSSLVKDENSYPLACPAITGCSGMVTCTNAFDSACVACLAGYYRSPSTGSCVGMLFFTGYYLTLLACTLIGACSSTITCTTATDSQCKGGDCIPGYYLQEGVSDKCLRIFISLSFLHTECTPVQACVSPLTCTNAFDSKCTACFPGFYLIPPSTPDEPSECTGMFYVS